jgi:nicotinate phosphoribosyltransferase
MIVNFSKRAHDHNFSLDPICRSLLDNDFYKLLMQQFIWLHFRDVPVTFSLLNRTSAVKLAEIVDETELRTQLDHARGLRFTKSELIWLAGNSFAGTRGIFRADFLEWLADYQLPEYHLERSCGQWNLEFTGPWAMSTLWEIPALSIVNELRTRTGLAKLNEFELDIFYARAKTKLWDKIERLRPTPDLKFADFGTRRRHSFLWQEFSIQAMRAELPAAFTGTSNAFMAMKHDLEAIGTNAHELPMVLAALAVQGRLGCDLKQSQYEVLRLWQTTYGGSLRVMLPDTFGSTQFLKDAPDWINGWTGIRVDSKEPVAAGQEYIDWLIARGQDPATKLLLFSDGLDVEDIVRLQAHFGQNQDKEPRCRIAFGWGTLLTNDFRGCHPRGLDDDFGPVSLVCKVSEVDGRPAVKLSDNYIKATGSPDEIERYRAVFGTKGVANIPVIV